MLSSPPPTVSSSSGSLSCSSSSSSSLPSSYHLFISLAIQPSHYASFPHPRPLPQREAQLVSRIALSFPIIADELPHPNPPDRFQALILQFWPKLSITLHSLPDSQSHSRSLSELTLSSSRLAKLQQQAPRDSFQVQNFRFIKLRIIWIGLQDGESDDERDGHDGDVYVEVNNSQDDENAQ